MDDGWMSDEKDKETKQRGSFWLGEWRVEPELNRIVRGDEVVNIEPRNMDVLLCLAQNPGRVYSTAELERHVWKGLVVTPNSVYQSIAQLRRSLGDDPANPRYIRTIPRKGYQLIAPVIPIAPSASDSPTPANDSERTSPQRLRSRIAVFAGGAALCAGLVVCIGLYGSKHREVTLPVPSSITFEALPRDSDVEPAIFTKLADAALAAGNPRNARAHLLNALEIERRRVGDKHTRVAEMLYMLANVQAWEGDFEAAEATARAALQTLADLNAPKRHPVRVQAIAQLGYVLVEAAKYDDAEPHLLEALELASEVFGDRSPTKTFALGQLALLRLSQGHYAQAEQAAREAIAIGEEVGAAIQLMTQQRGVVVRSLLAQSRYAEALTESERALSNMENVRKDHPHKLACRHWIALSLIGLGEHARAEALLRENLALWQNNDGWSAWVASTASALGEALLGQDRIAEAEGYLLRASLDLKANKSRQEQMQFAEHQRRLALLETTKQARRAAEKTQDSNYRS